MTERPIIFSAPMVRAILDGRKTMTRRVLRHGWAPKNRIVSVPDGPNKGLRVIPYAVGDRLWVREAFFPEVSGDKNFPVWYRATDEEDFPYAERWRSPIHMPRWASRITLEVTAVKVERLQNMNRGDAMEEGCPFPNMAAGPNPLDWFRDLWTSLHGPGSWEANPWVAAISFRRIA